MMYDFIVIGSGPSGGVAAKNLHDAGAKVLLLEAGKFYRKNTFPRSEADFSAKLFWGGGIEFDKSAKTGFIRAKCVGGTSIVNQCLLDRFDEDAYSDWKHRSGVDFFNTQDMQQYYENVEKNVVLHNFTEKDMNRNAKLFTSSCDSLGYKWKFLRRGQTDCQIENGNDCVGCLGGCHRDSKQSTLVTSIQKAEATGMEIIAEFNAEQLTHFDDHVVVRGIVNGETKELKAAKVIVAAGSFGTTQLLLRSGMGDRLNALGKGFSQHPQYMSFGIFDEPVDAHKGAFQTVASGDPDFRKKGIKLENVYAGPISIGMLFNAYGKPHQELMKKYRHMACIEVAVRDEPAGHISIDKNGKLQVSKPFTAQDLQRRDTGLEVIDTILQEAGAKEIVRSLFTFGLHLMGGCPIGTDVTNSVVDPQFRVHGFKNISIADSSIFPSAPGINPSLTIMALAQKMSEELLKQ